MSANAYLLIAAVCWASWQILAKVLLRHISPIEAQAIYTVSALAFIPIYLYRGAFQGQVSWTGIGLAILTSIVGTVATIAYSSGLSSNPVNGAVVVVSAYPILSCLMAVPLLGETLTWQKIAGLMLVIIGVWVAR